MLDDQLAVKSVENIARRADGRGELSPKQLANHSHLRA